MSSSRILSSRPSASCITAKPIARTIKGRGRNAPPFFAAQKLGKLSGLFRQSRWRHLLYGSPPRKPHSPLLGAVGRWAFPYRLTGSGEAEGAFPPEPPEALVLYGCAVPETAQSIAGAQWGTGASHYPAGSRKAERAFPPEPAGGTALCLSAPETAWLIAGALALLRHPVGSRKAEGAFPSEPAGGTDLRLAA